MEIQDSTNAWPTSHDSRFDTINEQSELPDIRGRTASVISIPNSIAEGLLALQGELLDAAAASGSDGLAVQAIDDNDDDTILPQYTMAAPVLPDKTDGESRHTRGNSSLQEPDMAALLAKLEVENNALAKDPKSGMAAVGAHTGPDSAFEYRIRNNVCSSLSMVVLTEAVLGMSHDQFWSRVTNNYHKMLINMPTMTPLMIYKGVPDSMRRSVWIGMCRADDEALQFEYESLVERLENETAPHEIIINKDLARCFPRHELFKDPLGEGQRMLGQVLKAYSLYDPEIGYCQGMAFVVGILLMKMPHDEAFCVLVRMMEKHNLRTLYLPSLEGLHIRTYQLKQLLANLSPALLEHMSHLGVELAYLSQWFMTLFAASCPLNVVFRLYDVILAEGADETMMRVALALIVTNESRIMAMTELEEVLQLLLGRTTLWQPYVAEPDNLIDEIARLCNVVTRAELDNLGEQFQIQSQSESGDKTVRSLGFTSGLVNFKFLDGWWSGTPTAKHTARAASTSVLMDGFGHRSKSSVSKSSVNSLTTAHRDESGAGSPLNITSSRNTVANALDSGASLASVPNGAMKSSKISAPNDDEQVEDLLLALTQVQREAADMALSLQEERTKRESMSELVHRVRDLVTYKEKSYADGARRERRQTMPSRISVVTQAQTILEELGRKTVALDHMARSASLNNLALKPAEELHDSLARLCKLLESEPATPFPVARELVTETGQSMLSQSPAYFPQDLVYEDTLETPVAAEPVVRARSSSLVAREQHVESETVPTQDAILMELVSAKTREAAALHDRDNLKIQFDLLRNQNELLRSRDGEWAARFSELERKLASERVAHTAELAKVLARREEKQTSMRKMSMAPPQLEVKTERSNSLWPENPGSALFPPSTADSESGSGNAWWWSRGKQRSISSGEAAHSRNGSLW